MGLAIEPKTGELWTAVNERDMLGDNLVPDYTTHLQDGGFYVRLNNATIAISSIPMVHSCHDVIPSACKRG